MRLTEADIKLLPEHIQEQIRRKLGEQPKPKKQRKKKEHKESPLEVEFDRLVKLFGLPAPEKEVQLEQGRKWALDRVWRGDGLMLAVEIDGETNHARYHQITRDAIKRNRAKELGWHVVVFTGAMLTKDPAGCMEQLKKLLA